MQALASTCSGDIQQPAIFKLALFLIQILYVFNRLIFSLSNRSNWTKYQFWFTPVAGLLQPVQQARIIMTRALAQTE